ncbi:hypothetical protein GGE62_003592 [Rhizobium leguminosarum]|uniref:hypothetical protein n=1 Tax=Rhizobium leguminosarum TaxID=384 RepID=UPI0017E085DC|nr:hypothetical protein [Rhizobium leguminosarum]MBB4523528.1 hypothetical protein [Rhizobium leguminosarum]
MDDAAVVPSLVDGQARLFFKENNTCTRPLFQNGHGGGKTNYAAAYNADVVNHCDTHSQSIEVNAESRADPTSRTCERDRLRL